MSGVRDWVNPVLALGALCLGVYAIYRFAPLVDAHVQYRVPNMSTTEVGVAYDPSIWPQGQYRHVRRPNGRIPEYGDERGPAPPEMEVHGDPRFKLFERRCRQQLAIRQAEDPTVPFRVRGGPGQRSSCYIGSTFREEGAIE